LLAPLFWGQRVMLALELIAGFIGLIFVLNLISFRRLD
jgi:hypothetical protein